MSVQGRIYSEESFSTLDGPGVRYVVFLQGCPLRCKYCHNADSWDFKGGISTSANDVLTRILSCKSFIQGVTLSGGEPLMQPDFCSELLSLCKENGLNTAIDTSGAVSLDKCINAVDIADFILLDIKASSDEMCKKLTGITLKNPIELLNYCERKSKKVWIRHVLLKGYTLDKAQLHNLGRLLSNYSCIEETTVLPFHKMGEYKWKNSSLKYELSDIPVPTHDEMTWAKKILSEYLPSVK